LSISRKIIGAKINGPPPAFAPIALPFHCNSLTQL